MPNMALSFPHPAEVDSKSIFPDSSHFSENTKAKV
jgi:hypothetical protein